MRAWQLHRESTGVGERERVTMRLPLYGRNKCWIFHLYYNSRANINKNKNCYIIFSLYVYFPPVLAFLVLQLWDFSFHSGDVLFSMLADGRTLRLVRKGRRWAMGELRKLILISNHPFFYAAKSEESRVTECNKHLFFSPACIHRWIPLCLSNIYFRLHLASTNYARREETRSSWSAVNFR